MTERTPEQLLAETVRQALACLPHSNAQPAHAALAALLARLQAAERQRDEAKTILDEAHKVYEAESKDWIDWADPSDPDEALPPWQARWAKYAALAAVSRGTPEAKETE